MSEMVERVARAICQPPCTVAERATGCCGECGPIVVRARAAIEAMREPTEGMAKALLAHGRVEPSVLGGWQMMIDEALKA